jgi:hypothetical protein
MMFFRLLCSSFSSPVCAQVQAMKGSRKKVFDDSELFLQCESEAERDDWMRLLKACISGP